MIPLKKLVVNAGQDALFEPSKVTEQSLRSVKVAELAVLTVVTVSYTHLTLPTIYSV